MSIDDEVLEPFATRLGSLGDNGRTRAARTSYQTAERFPFLGIVIRTKRH